MTSRLKSDRFLKELDTLNRTGHAARLYPKLEAFSLTANIPESWVDIPGLPSKHPVLSFRDIVKCLSDSGKMDLILPNDVPLESFWQRYKQLEPSHPVYIQHGDRLENVVPIVCHADEGTSQKKRGIMILNISPVIGHGTSRGGDGLNFVGQSVKTRFLYSTMLSKLYGGKKSGRLRSLVTHLAHELKSCFVKPISVVVKETPRELYFCCIGCKGDWPALVKLGRLDRHHLRDSNKKAPGICHLCHGGQEGFPWHMWDFESMQRMRQGLTEPFTIPGGGPLTKIVPQPGDLAGKVRFFRPDVFHNCHKGLVGDLASNAIVAHPMLSCNTIFLSNVVCILFCEAPYKSM